MINVESKYNKKYQLDRIALIKLAMYFLILFTTVTHIILGKEMWN